MRRWSSREPACCSTPISARRRWSGCSPTGRELRAAGERLAFGTIDSWLVWKLTGGAVHATDASNASRTMLMALDGGGWDEELCGLFGVDPASCRGSSIAPG